MRKLQLLVCFAVANFAGICLFYIWILGSQLKTRSQRGRASDVMIFTSSAEHARYENRGNYHSHEERKESRNDIDTWLTHTLEPVKSKTSTSLHQIPPVPKVSDGDDVPSLDEEIMKEYLAYPKRGATETVLILTPIHNVAGQLKKYLQLLQSITYPHLLISVALGEDSSHDNTLHAAEEIAKELKKSFRRVNVFHFNISGQVEGTWFNVHTVLNQYRRRKHLAQARNLLLKAGYKDQDWVLWLDSDIGYFPPDIIQQLLSAKKDVVAPLCIYMDGKRKRVYDKNTWRETPLSLRHQETLSEYEVMFEGYQPTKRLWLSDLRAEGRVVPIDGVGGCTLLVRASCHQKGLVFPEKPFEHHLETEGLAKMAKSMNCSVYGMPFVEVKHS
ncbi:hypothetical protein BaRGS_00020516 [Batillaria attramentaria]|uniref:Uncharacterized protein n=1 Tax=Batillaria attramentaria TaxID=370345 RepID=A0ABD0KM63_9CAEN